MRIKLLLLFLLFCQVQLEMKLKLVDWVNTLSFVIILFFYSYGILKHKETLKFFFEFILFGVDDQDGLQEPFIRQYLIHLFIKQQLKMQN